MQIYLRTFGTKLRIKNGLFVVSFYDKAQKLKQEEFAVDEVDSIWAQSGTSLSVDAIQLAISNDIDLVILDRLDRPSGRFYTHRPSSTTLIQKAQLQASLDPVSLHFVQQWISTKIDHQIRFLKELKERRRGEASGKLAAYIENIEPVKQKILELPLGLASEKSATIHGLEGTASRIYFEAISYVLPERYRFDGRSRRPPKDIFNAFLSYGYGILYNQIERSLIKGGLNPYVGFLHRDDYQFKSLVFDFIEPFRIYIDRLVFRLFSQKKVYASHVREVEGGFYLNEAGKEILLITFRKHFYEKKLPHRGKQHVLHRIIDDQARQFSKTLMQYREEKTENFI